MFNGRIDTQGTIADFRASGRLTDVAHLGESTEPDEQLEEYTESSTDNDATEQKEKQSRPLRRLVEEEHRETGSVSWRVYGTYLKAA